MTPSSIPLNFNYLNVYLDKLTVFLSTYILCLQLIITMLYFPLSLKPPF